MDIVADSPGFLAFLLFLATALITFNVIYIQIQLYIQLPFCLELPTIWDIPLQR